MKISFHDLVNAGNGARNRDPAPEQHLRWRKELELAQWQSRLRYQPAHRIGSPAGGEAQAVVERAEPRMRSDPSGRSPLPAESEHARVAPRAEGDAPRARLVAAIVAERAGIPVTDIAVPVTMGGSKQEATTLRPQSARPAPPAMPFELAEWPAAAVHVSMQGNRLSVALRDPRITESERLALYHRLRSQCIAWGLELTELTINGHLVDPVGSD
jgi:hypothetical protein